MSVKQRIIDEMLRRQTKVPEEEIWDGLSWIDQLPGE